MKLIPGYTGRPFEGKYGAYDPDDAYEGESGYDSQFLHGGDDDGLDSPVTRTPVPNGDTTSRYVGRRYGAHAPPPQDEPGGLSRRQLLVGAGASLAAAACYPDGPSIMFDPGDGDGQAAYADADLPPEFRGDPVFLNAAKVLQPNGDAGEVNEEALRNPFPFPIEITELRFFGSTQLTVSNSSSTGAYQYQNSPLSQIGAALALGNVPVTQNYVPVNLICPGGSYFMESPTYGASGNQACGSLNLRLSRPLILRPKELLACSLQHRGILSSSINVNVGYIGRTRQDLVGKLGRSRRVPYIAAWTPQALTQPAYSASTPPANYAQSAETDLQNKLDVDFNLDYFIGRLNAVGTTGGSYVVATELTDTQYQAYSKFWPGTDKVQLAVWDNQGFPTVAPGTPFRLAFGNPSRVMKVGSILSPGDYYVAQVSVLPPSASGYAVAATSQIPLYAGLSMVGWREVPYA